MYRPIPAQEVLNKFQSKRADYKKDIDAGRLRVSEYLESGPRQLEKLVADFTTCLKNGTRKIRLLGNVSEGVMARKSGLEHVLQYERNYDLAIAKKFPVVTLCQYDLRSHGGVDIGEVLKCHPDSLRHPLDRMIS